MVSPSKVGGGPQLLNLWCVPAATLADDELREQACKIHHFEMQTSSFLIHTFSFLMHDRCSFFNTTFFIFTHF